MTLEEAKAIVQAQNYGWHFFDDAVNLYYPGGYHRQCVQEYIMFLNLALSKKTNKTLTLESGNETIDLDDTIVEIERLEFDYKQVKKIDIEQIEEYEDQIYYVYALWAGKIYFNKEVTNIDLITAYVNENREIPVEETDVLDITEQEEELLKIYGRWKGLEFNFYAQYGISMSIDSNVYPIQGAPEAPGDIATELTTIKELLEYIERERLNFLESFRKYKESIYEK